MEKKRSLSPLSVDWLSTASLGSCLGQEICEKRDQNFFFFVLP